MVTASKRAAAILESTSGSRYKFVTMGCCTFYLHAVRENILHLSFTYLYRGVTKWPMVSTPWSQNIPQFRARLQDKK